MKSNKGYSLVELLCALAVFSIVMIGIVALMRTVSVSFKNENYEIEVEKDSQVLMAQLEELLVDCKLVKNTLGDSSDKTSEKAYQINDIDGSHHLIYYDSAQGELRYYDDASSTDYELLAKGIKEFTIDGIKGDSTASGTGNADKDNMVVLDLTMSLDSKGYTNDSTDGTDYTYSCNKSISLRNNVDGEDLGLPNLDTTGAAAGTANVKQLELGRYQVANLKSLYDIVSVTSLASSSNAYMFCDPSNSYMDANNGLSSIHELTGGTSVYITTSATANTDTTTDFSGVLEGLNSAGDTITVNITTKKVKIIKGAGFIEMPCANVNNTTNQGGGGFYSYIQMEGICLADYDKYFNKKGSWDIQVIANNSSKGHLSGSIVPNSQNNNSVSSSQITNLGISGLNRIENVGICYDVNSPNYIVVKYHNCDCPSNTSVLSNNNLSYKIKLSIPFYGTPSSGGSPTPKTYEETFRVYCGGTNMGGLN